MDECLWPVDDTEITPESSVLGIVETSTKPWFVTWPLGVGQSIRVETLKKLGKLAAVGSCPETLGRDNARQAGWFSWTFQRAPLRAGQLFIQAIDRLETARKKWV